MSRNRLLVGGLVIVAAIVIAYFAFVYPPVSKEDTSGAIGVANKYRNEQITDKDVILKDEETAAAAAMAVMSADEKAAMFERATADLQGRMLAQASPEVASALIGRADATMLARLFKGLDAQQRVEFFARAPKPTQDAILRAANVTAERYSKMTVEERSTKVLERASDMHLAAVVKEATMQEKTSFFAKADFALRNEFMKLLDRNDKIAVMERAPATAVAEMERTNFAINFFEKAAPEQQFEMLAKSPEVTSALMGRADAASLARLFKGLDAQQRVEFFARAPKPTQDAILRTANVAAERYAKMTVDEKSTKVIGRASDMQLAAIVKETTMQDRTSFFAKADFALRNDFIKLLDRSDKFTLMGRAPAPMVAEMERANFAATFFGKAAPEQQFEMLAKSPEMAAATMGRADNVLLARLFKGLDAQQRVEFFARAPKPTQDAMFRAANVTAERYAKMTVDEKSAKVLERAADMDLAAIVKQATLQEKTSFFAKADFALRSDFVKLLDRSDRFNLMGRAPEQMKVDMERAYTEMSRASREQQ
jgi:Mg/Co/Ni transporter MgtE